MMLNRREALKTIGIGTLMLVGGDIIVSGLNPARLAYASEEEKWKQFAGSKLFFYTENTPPSEAVKAYVHNFEDLTGIQVEIRLDYIEIIEQALRARGLKDFNIFYTQDTFSGGPHLVDYGEELKKFENDPTLPKVRDGVGDDVWANRWLDVTGRFYDKDKVLAYPYDNAVDTTMYRKDIFEKYSPKFEQEYGKPLVYNENTTWKDVLDICHFFNKHNFPDCKYGITLFGKKGWPLQVALQWIMYSHGQWKTFNFDMWYGSRKPGPCNWGDAQSIESLKHFKELMDAADPASLEGNWFTAHEAYTAGRCAMVVNCNEFAAAVEDPKTSVAAGGRTVYAVSPKGESSWIVNGGRAVHSTPQGIGGIAINRFSDEKLKKAAYLFALWATSHDVQLNTLRLVGGTPTRKSVFEEPIVVRAMKRETAPMKKIEPTKMPDGTVVTEVPEMPNALTYPAVLKATLPPDVIPGPKIPTFIEFIDILSKEVTKFLNNMATAEQTAKALKKNIDRLHGV